MCARIATIAAVGIGLVGAVFGASERLGRYPDRWDDCKPVAVRFGKARTAVGAQFDDPRHLGRVPDAVHYVCRSGRAFWR